MPTLREGSTGPLARLFNDFLRAQGYEAGTADIFDGRSDAGTRAFQARLREGNSKIVVDGIAGNQTLGRACGVSTNDSLSPQSIAQAVGVVYPPRLPGLPPSPKPEQMQTMFGEIQFRGAPTSKDPDRIVITNGWDTVNIVPVRIPQLVGIANAPASGKVSAHRLITRQLQGVWAAWEAQGLISQITVYSGLWVPRFKRDSKRQGLKDLSNHTWGTAFDINASANNLGHLPAFPGENGSLFSHVAIAQAYGFGWGGHYSSRLDGMHFEVVKILSDAELGQVNAQFLG